MKRRFQGLAATVAGGNEIPDGVFLVRVEQARYVQERQKAFYAVRFSVIEPTPWAERTFSSRLVCTTKALWKLSRFLRDFGYDPELLARDEVEEKGLVGLRGVAKISHVVVNGRQFVNLDAFAPAGAWVSIDSRSQVAS